MFYWYQLIIVLLLLVLLSLLYCLFIFIVAFVYCSIVGFLSKFIHWLLFDARFISCPYWYWYCSLLLFVFEHRLVFAGRFGQRSLICIVPFIILTFMGFNGLTAHEISFIISPIMVVIVIDYDYALYCYCFVQNCFVFAGRFEFGLNKAIYSFYLYCYCYNRLSFYCYCYHHYLCAFYILVSLIILQSMDVLSLGAVYSWHIHYLLSILVLLQYFYDYHFH